MIYGLIIVNLPLLILSCILFVLSFNKDISLAEVIHSQGHNIKFRKTLTGCLLVDWTNLLNRISQIAFTHAQDRLAIFYSILIQVFEF